MNRAYGLGAALLLVVGLSLSVGGLALTLDEDRRIADGARTNGTVVATGVERVPGEDVYRPNVTYRYTVEGTTYTTDRLFPSTIAGTGSRDWAREVAGEYDPGDTVTVTYDPDSPEVAYVRERRSPGPIIGFGLGLVSLAFAFVLGVAAFQEDRDFVHDEKWRIAREGESGEEGRDSEKRERDGSPGEGDRDATNGESERG